MEERIIKLESLAAQQDQTIGELNREIFRQQQDISKLKSRISRLEEKLAARLESEQIAGNERPPHY